MKSIKSDLYGIVVQPESFNEIIELITTPIDDLNLVRMWRGQGDISCPIHSSAYRRLIRDHSVVRERDIIFYETTLLKQASHKGYRFMDGKYLSDLELLARLQHHGAATRLMDFSRNAMVALWFASTNCKSTIGLLIGIHTNFIGGYESELDERKYEEIVDELKIYDYPMTWEPPIVSKRISSQHAQFLYSRISNEKTGSLELPKDDGANLLIAISPKLKELVNDYLLTIFDIREYTLFPDLEGFCQANSTMNDRNRMYRW